MLTVKSQNKLMKTKETNGFIRLQCMSYSYLIPYYFVSLTLNNSATSECLYPLLLRTLSPTSYYSVSRKY